MQEIKGVRFKLDENKIEGCIIICRLEDVNAVLRNTFMYSYKI